MKPIYQSEKFSLWPDHVVQGSFNAHAPSPSEIDSTFPNEASASGGKWTLQSDLSKFPKTKSDYPLLDALYNLSLEELMKDTRDDGAFNAGAKWQGVWTRDVSYSILLSLAAVNPEGAKASLRHKVKRDRIVQDTGTGGSWPVSTDRMTWALAAWEIYLVTGDRGWLRESYTVIRNSILDDQQVVISPGTGLALGESSFLDWREQTYPRWMEPVDIYESKALGTNAVYFRTYRILSAMAHLLREPAEDWDARADRIKDALNDSFWVQSKGYYGQYLYGRASQSLSPRAEALGEALSMLFGIADVGRQRKILSSQPLLDYGVPTVYPETPNIPPYHNRSVWPFVQAFWNLAAAKRQDGSALVYGLASTFRSAALFTTNKENFVGDTGDAAGTVINSDRQLWSVAGNLAMVYRVFFGMDFEEDGLHLHPVVPEEFKGPRTLSNFSYRQATLDIEVRGFGYNIRSFTIDDAATGAVIPPNLTGHHKVIVELSDQPLQSGKLNLVVSKTAPETPEVSLDNGSLTWKPIDGAAKYAIFRDGKPFQEFTQATFAVPASANPAEYQVEAVDKDGATSFLSAPVTLGEHPILSYAKNAENPSDPANVLTLESAGNTNASMTAKVPASGKYLLSFRYANGSGPINTDNKCAIRTLFIDGQKIGPIVMPQRGQDAWSLWGASSSQSVQLKEGDHRVELRLEPSDRNMNGEVNRALVQPMVLVPVDRPHD